jgi:hypothetical protein
MLILVEKERRHRSNKPLVSRMLEIIVDKLNLSWVIICVPKV